MRGQIGAQALVDGQSPMGLFGFQEDFVSANHHQTDGVALFDIVGVGSALSEITSDNGVVSMNCGAGSRLNLATQAFPFRLDFGKRLMMGARINLQNFDAISFFIGLTVDDTTIVADLPANIAGFFNDEDDGTIDALSRASSTSSRVEQTAHAFTADNQWRELKMLWDGNGRLTYYIDGALTQLFTTNIPTRTALAFAMEIQSETAETLWIDFVYCWQER